MHDWCVGLLFVAVMGVISHVVGVVIPRRGFHHDRVPFRTWPCERDGHLYDTLRVARWKEFLPDMSRILPDLYTKSVPVFPTAAHLERLLQESCVAELTHYLLIFCSPMLCQLVPGSRGVLFAVLYALGNVPYVMIQRYNRPKMARLYRRLLLRETRQAEEHSARRI